MTHRYPHPRAGRDHRSAFKAAAVSTGDTDAAMLTRPPPGSSPGGYEAAVGLDGEVCDGGHVQSPWLLGANPRWRLTEGQRAAVTEPNARASPARG